MKRRSTRPRRALRLSCEQLEPRLVLADRVLHLDGTGDHLRVADVPIPASQMTVEAWIFRHETTRCEEILAGATFGSFELWLCDNGRVKWASNNNVAYVTGPTPIPSLLWTHVAATWKAGERQKLYINGELELDTPAGPSPAPALSTDTIMVGAWLNTSGNDSYHFNGTMSEVRMWDRERTQSEIRGEMNHAIDDTRNGLIFNLHLNENGFAESVRGLAVTNFWNAQIVYSSPTSPVQVRIAQTDQNFATIAPNGVVTRRYAAGTIYVPETDRAYLLGGFVEGLPTGQIVSFDMGSGLSTYAGNLPGARGYATAAYVPSMGRAYVFGGALDYSITQLSNNIHRFEPATGQVTTLAVTLPQAMFTGSAVYHERLDKIVLLGGSTTTDLLDTIIVFDPRTETFVTLPTRLPEGRAHATAAYSAITNKIYLFGGVTWAGPAGTNSVYEIALSADAASAVVQPVSGVSLPVNTFGQGAVVDPATQLIYLIGGFGGNDYVLAFDPIASRLFRTMIRLPRAPNGPNGWSEGIRQNVPFPSVVYSPRQRHALVIGGGNSYELGTSSIWRVPLGNGAAVPIERWDFPTGVGALVTGIDGNDRGVYVSTGGNATWGIDENDARYRYDIFGALANANDVAIEGSNLWVSTSNTGAARYQNGTWTTYNAEFGTNNVQTVDPDFPAFGTNRGLFLPYIGFPGYGQYWEDAIEPYTYVRGLASDPNGSGLWGVTYATPVLEGAAGPPKLQQFYYDEFLTPNEVPHGSACGNGTTAGDLNRYDDLTFDSSGNLWVVGAGRGQGTSISPRLVCYISADKIRSGNLTGASKFASFNGIHGTGIAADADGRVWVSSITSKNQPNFPAVESGGLSVWESKGPASVSTTDYNWLNAPVGTRNLHTDGTTKVWDSGFTAVGAVDEKVWAGRGDGSLVTVAQRWQQSDYLSETQVDKISTVRGRVFFSSPFYLYVLQPDGATWDFRLMGGSKNVFGDSRGNTWIGTTGGLLYQYLPSGWDTLADRAGTKPMGAINVFAESRDENPNDEFAGPVWIGGQNGLTVFDRNRFVTTFTRTNSGLPNTTVTALLVDRQNRVWAGTPEGLAVLSADRGTWTTYTTFHGLPNNSIYDLAELGDGRIAISTAAGVTLYNGVTFTTQSPPVSAANLPLTVDQDGNLWAGSAVLTANGWQGHWYTNSGLKYSNISDNAADGADRVWFSHYPNPGVSIRGAYLPPLKDVQPVITSVTPMRGTSGDVLTIRGGGFGGNPNEIDVTVGGAKVEIVGTLRDDFMQVKLGDDAVSGSVIVERTGRSDVESGFCAAPQITSFTPIGANTGMQVTITGKNFDPNAQVTVGGVEVIGEHVVSPTQIRFIVESDMPAGALSIGVRNACIGETATSGTNFNKINLSVTNIEFNQGLRVYGVVEEKPTLFQSFLSAGRTLGTGEAIEIDEIRYVITAPDGSTYEAGQKFPGGTTPPNWHASPTPASSADITSSVNVGNVQFRDPGLHQVKASVYRRGRFIDDFTTTVDVLRNYVTRVLFVPIMRFGSTPAELQAMKSNLDGNLGDLTERLMPFGTVEYEWSPEVIYESTPFSLRNALSFYGKASALDRARTHWNAAVGSKDVQIAFGIVDPRLTLGSSSGFAFWPDATEMLNKLFLDKLDELCDIGDKILSVVKITDGTGCNLSIPSQIGWARGAPRDTDAASADPLNVGELDGDGMQDPMIDADNNGTISEAEFLASLSPTGGREDQLIGFNLQVGGTIAHELGHIAGLVKPYAANGSLLDNISHSINDEINGTNTCSDAGATFDWSKSLYRQMLVTEPVVNPIRGEQYPSWNDGNIRTPRGKAIMSYACTTLSANMFFEPIDLNTIDAQIAALIWPFVQLGGLLGGSPNAADAPAGAPAADFPSGPPAAAAPIPQPGPRLQVAGMVSTSGATGDIAYVESLGDDTPLSVPFATDYWVVQRDAAGNELDRLGVLPISAIEGGEEIAFFTATVLQRPGAARVELLHGTTLLDTFTASAAPPVVAITSPLAGQAYFHGTIPVAFTATDTAGDSVAAIVEYSADNGLTWKHVGSAAGSAAVDVDIASLAGSAGQARIRVTATDGLNRASATSGAFTVNPQDPRPFIYGATRPTTALEGQPIALSGGAMDNQDGPLEGASLQWTSDREGPLGEGGTVHTSLFELGWHTITLTARNSLGLTATATQRILVGADYDFDGIGDAAELALSLNPLYAADAFSDADDDGLAIIAEIRRGTNHRSLDTDFDGRSDGVEVLEQTNVSAADASPPAAAPLSVVPSSIAFAADLARDAPLPQQSLAIVSNGAAPWTLATNVDWLEATVAGGSGSANVLLRVQAYELVDGDYTATLQVTQGTAIVQVPITLSVSNRSDYYDVNGDGQTTVGDCDAVESRIGAHFGDPLYHYRYDINRDGVILASDAARCDSSVTPPLPGDFTGDGRVDLADLARLQAHLGTLSGASFADGDMTNDGVVDRRDAAAFSQVFGRQQATASAPAAIIATATRKREAVARRRIAATQRAPVVDAALESLSINARQATLGRRSTPPAIARR